MLHATQTIYRMHRIRISAAQCAMSVVDNIDQTITTGTHCCVVVASYWQQREYRTTVSSTIRQSVSLVMGRCEFFWNSIRWRAPETDGVRWRQWRGEGLYRPPSRRGDAYVAPSATTLVRTTIWSHVVTCDDDTMQMTNFKHLPKFRLLNTTSCKGSPGANIPSPYTFSPPMIDVSFSSTAMFSTIHKKTTGFFFF